MPLPNIKGLKALGRRKSAGNSIEEGLPTAAASGSSFRVIPRDDANRKSIGGPVALDGRPAAHNNYLPARQNSDEDYELSNRGSGSTATSSQSRIFDAASGTRFSSSSTLQSPVEVVTKEPQFPPSGSQSHSFLNISTEIDNSDEFGDLFSGFNNRKSQLMEDSRLFSKPPAPAVLRTESEPLITSNPSRGPFFNRASKTPPPFSHGRGRDGDKSPYSAKSRTSRDGLMSSPYLDDSPVEDEPPQVPQHSTALSNNRDGFAPVATSPLGPKALQRSMSNESFTASGANGDADAQMVNESVRAVRASTIQSSMYEGSPLGRAQKIKNESLGQTQASPVSGSPSSGNSLHTPSMTSSASSFNAHDDAVSQRPNQTTTPTPLGRPAAEQSSTSTTPRANEAKPADIEDPLFDASIVNAIRSVELHDSFTSREPLSAPPRPPMSDEPKRIYTAKQFEILSKHANRQTDIKSSRSDSEDEYEDDEDDEATVLQKRRVQQQKEAQHLIWRQRMTKDIGDQSSPLPGRPAFPRINQSTPNLSFGHVSNNSLSDAAGSGGSSDDEDVPLGVLQAHGFPKKDQPADPRLSANSYVGRPTSTVGPLPPRPGSPARSVAGGNRNSVLPPFARRLPHDPYMGQGDLVNPANRESMGFNRASVAQSVYMPAGPAAPAAPALPVPQLPGGLVGVIAEEERQRGMRRGSPNAQARQSTVLPQGVPMMPPMPGMGPMGMGPGMMPMMPGPGVSPEQLQLNQQMFQLMQQQAAMLEQMYSQVSQFGQMPGMPQGGFQQPNPQARPLSMASSNARPGYAQSRTRSMINIQPPPTQRTLSMVNLPNQGWGPDSFMSGAGSIGGLGLGLQNPGYAPSVAPSERSNIGQPSRYKPVQSSQLADGGSTITAGSTIGPTPVAEKKKSFLSAIIHAPHRGKGKENIAEEEDEDDWNSFAKKRNTRIL